MSTPTTYPPPKTNYTSPPPPPQTSHYATPPPPPPKPSRQPTTTTTTATPTPYSGPPLPPHPPSSNPTPQTQGNPTPTPAQILPPEPGEHWLPPILLDKPTTALTPLLTSPPHLTALSQSHPSLHPSTSPLPPHLQQTLHLATHLQTQHTHLLSLRATTQRALLSVLAQERAWRAKQREMDTALEAWSAKALYVRLREAEREAEGRSRAAEERFLDGMGGGEREVGEFLKGWREGRVVLARRREMRERWDEGRVGGWR